jgi:hypothetical protein
MTLYHCPDCERVHDEPYEAVLGLFARCVDCALGSDHRDHRAALEALPQAA